MKRSFLFSMAVLMLLFVVGCGGGNTTPDSPNQQRETMESTSKELKEQNSDQVKEAQTKEKETKQDEKKSDSKSKSNSSDKHERHEEKHKQEKAEKNTKQEKIKKDNKPSKQEHTKDNKSLNSSKPTSKQKSEKDTSKSTSKDSKSSPSKSSKQSKPSDTSKKQPPKQVKPKHKTDTSKSNTPKNHKTEKPKEKPVTPPKQSVTISVNTGDVKGTVLSKTSVSIDKGDTVLDATQRILKKKGIQISVRGSKGSAYIEGIDNLYEFDNGPLSGWQVLVNGTLIDRGAGALTVKNDESINWHYTTDYTKD